MKNRVDYIKDNYCLISFKQQKMKKLVLLIVAMLAIAGTSKAQTNALSVANIELPQNGDAELVVSFQLDAPDTYTGYSFNIEFPSDLSFEMDSETGPTDVYYEKSDAHHNSHSVSANLNEGEVKVACLSLSSTPLQKQSGELLTFTIKAGDLTIGNTYTGKIKNILFVPVQGEKVSLPEVTFTITIIENDGRVKFNENATKLPKFTVGSKANVTMTRSLKGGLWNTIVLPFTLTKAKAEAAFGSDVELAEFNGFVVDYGDDDANVIPLGITINLVPYTMTSKKGMTGGKPFFIKPSQNIESFQADEVSMVGTVTDTEKSDENETPGKLTGSFVKTVIPADGLFINNNTFWYSTGKTSVKAFRCWFELGAVLDKETDFGAPVFISFDNNITDIQNIRRTAEDDKYYNLNGQLVESLKKGQIYIKNNKKVVVK